MTGEQWYLGIHSEGSIDDTRKATLLGEVGYRGITEHPSKEEARKEGELMLRKLRELDPSVVWAAVYFFSPFRMRQERLSGRTHSFEVLYSDELS